MPLVGIEDYSYLKESIEEVLAINSTPGKGTSFGQSIRNVAGKYSTGDQAKLIILFSDGEPFYQNASGMSRH